MTGPKPHVTSLLLTRRALALKRHLAAAIKGDGTGVHQARVASRRLREAVPVLAADVKGSRKGNACHKIRRLTRALGKVRELDVTLALLDEMAQRETFPRAALEDVRGRVIAAREEGRARMLTRLEKIRLDKLDRRLEQVAGALDAERADAWRRVLAQRLLKRAKRLAAAIDHAGHIYAPDRLHDVRVAVKKLRYAMELAAEAGWREAARQLATLKRAQATLGRLQDLRVLQTHVSAVLADPSHRTSSDRGLGIISAALERECRHLHGRYMALVPSLHAVATSTRSSLVPQVGGLPDRSRPLKMRLAARSAERVRAVAGRG